MLLCLFYVCFYFIASLNETINLSPHENILTAALINIHYLYNVALSYLL